MKTFDIAIKKSRKQHLIKAVGFSILGLLILSGLCLKMLQIMTASNGQKALREHELLSQVAYPNIENDSYYYKATGLFSGTIHADRFKDLAGIPVAFGDYDYHYDWLGTYLDFTQDGMEWREGVAYDRQKWSKLPIFYNVHKGADSIRVASQELPLVRDMQGQLVEVAVTFDKAYSYGELQELLPSNLKKNWYWLGTEGDMDTSNLRVDQLLGMRPEQLQVIAEDEQVPVKEREKNALTAMKELATRDFYVNDYRLMDDVDTFLEKFGQTDFSQQEQINRLEFSGVILTGRAEDFAQLENQGWIYASSIGISTPNQPYYQLHLQ